MVDKTYFDDFLSRISSLNEDLLSLDSKNESIGMPINSTYLKILHSAIEKVEDLDYTIKQVKVSKTDTSFGSESKRFLESKIAVLNNNLKDADDEIESLENSIHAEKEKADAFSKKYYNLLKDFEQSKNILDEMNSVLLVKNNEIDNLNLRINSITSNYNNKSEEYMNKLNEGNLKVIQCKNEKIKTLEIDITKFQSYMKDHTNKIKELEDAIRKLEEDKTYLNSIILEYKGSEPTQSIDYENQLGKEAALAFDENKRLKKELSLLKNINLNSPLLDNDRYTHFDEIKSRKFCCILM